VLREAVTHDCVSNIYIYIYIYLITNLDVTNNFCLQTLITTADIACGADDFDILCKALQISGLDGLLDGPGPFTVFAPADEGFHKLMSKLRYDAVEELSVEDLTDLLEYHVVVDSEIHFEELDCDEIVEMYNGETTKT
jgi:uncharacterized surface protein with fasciclin (FAS1) repeats